MEPNIIKYIKDLNFSYIKVYNDKVLIITDENNNLKYFCYMTGDIDLYDYFDEKIIHIFKGLSTYELFKEIKILINNINQGK